MPIRFDLASFVTGLGQIGAAGIAGRLAGQQQREAEELREFQIRQQLAAQQAEQQQGLGRTLLGMKLTPESQAQVGGWLAGQPSPIEGLRGLPYVQQRPEILPPAPPRSAVAQPAAPTVGGRTFATPAGRLQVAGVTDQERNQLSRQFADVDKAFTEVDLSDDPNLQAAVNTARESFPAQIQTPEDAVQARAALATLNRAKQGLGPRMETLRQRQRERSATAYGIALKNLQTATPAGAVGLIDQMARLEEEGAAAGSQNLIPPTFAGYEADIAEIRRRRDARDFPGAAERAQVLQQAVATRTDPARMGKSLGNFYKGLSLIAPTQRTPEVVRQLARNTQADWLIAGLPDESLLLGGAAAEKALQDFLKRISTQNFAGLSKEAQAAMLQEAGTLSEYLGRKVNLPAEIVGKLTPWQKAQLANQRDRIGIQGDMRDIAREHLAISRARLNLDREKARLDKLEKQGTLTALQRVEIDAKQRAVEDARQQLQEVGARLMVLPGKVDLDNPKPGDETRYAELMGNLQRAEDHYITHMRGLGIQVEPVTETKYKPPPKTLPAAEPERKSILGIPYGPAVQPPGTQPPAAAARERSGPVASPVKGRPTPDQALSPFPPDVRARLLALPKNAAGFPILPNEVRLRLIQALISRGRPKAEAQSRAGLFGPNTR